VARLIVASARRRLESRGLHFNLDHLRARRSLARPTVLRRGPAARPGLAGPRAAVL